MFHRFAVGVADHSGSPVAFFAALALVAGWLISGPFFGFSEIWQLVINTTTTIITFLMVFVIQHTQNVKDHAMHIKLDEIIRAMPDADDSLRGIEDA